ncbi:hypothetical protein AB0K00_53245 [Dactylosporangium sp. NPDC049525]|uniref:hypothetical protein n=1 Tax=Dactylosporangium sp. NPDC049525 TaxID=3154730 RepID=UPI0034369B28
MKEYRQRRIDLPPVIIMAAAAAAMTYILVFDPRSWLHVFMAGSICYPFFIMGYFMGPSASVMVDGDWVVVHNSFSSHTVLRTEIVGVRAVERERVYLKTATGRTIDVEAVLAGDSRRDQGRWRWRKTVRQTERLMEVIRRQTGPAAGVAVASKRRPGHWTLLVIAALWFATGVVLVWRGVVESSPGR